MADMNDMADTADMADVADKAAMSKGRFFQNLDTLSATSTFVVDRPRGTRHPRVPQAVYPVDYGYLDGTASGDGEGVDVFHGSAEGLGVVGVFVTADPEKRDVEVKVLTDCTTDEIEQIRHLLNDVLEIGGLLVPRREQGRPGA